MYLLKEKSEVPQIFEIFYSMIHTQYDTNIKILRIDNGRVYFNSVVNNFISKRVFYITVHVLSLPNKMASLKKKSTFI